MSIAANPESDTDKFKRLVFDQSGLGQAIHTANQRELAVTDPKGYMKARNDASKSIEGQAYAVAEQVFKTVSEQAPHLALDQRKMMAIQQAQMFVAQQMQLINTQFPQFETAAQMGVNETFGAQGVMPPTALQRRSAPRRRRRSAQRPSSTPSTSGGRKKRKCRR